jgi:tellurite resistance protein TerC
MLWIWIGFIVFVLFVLALDLGVFHRKAHAVSMKEALGWSAVWIALGLSFSVFIYFGYEHHWTGLGKSPDGVHVVDTMAVSADDPLGELDGGEATVKYLTGYVIEKSLSIDNLFVIAMLFAMFAVPAAQQHRLLFWGVLGALVMRGAMIWLGSEMLHKYAWIVYVFGGLLILTGLKMLFVKERETNPDGNLLVRSVRRFFPANPMFAALVAIEVSDLIFAVDSIPAIFAITSDPFIVFTSNVFAMLGLRSLYFALAGMINRFHYLKPALAVVLLVVGAKMLSHTWLKMMLGSHFNFYLLGVVMLILMAGVIASICVPRRQTATA